MTREEAIKGLKVLRKDFSGYKPNEEMFDMAIEALSDAPDTNVGKWTPCSEGLPKEDGSYWVCGRWSSGKVAVGDCEYSTDDGYFLTAWNFDVIAWMPLPEPYREDSNA